MGPWRPDQKKEKKECATIIQSNTKRKGFSDLTEASPHKSISGNLYVMVLYDFYSNVILAEPIKKASSDYL